MTSTSKRQSPRHPDRARARNVQLQARDLAVLKQIVDDRFLTLSHLTALFFPSEHMAKKRLQKLWNAGYVKREFAPSGFDPGPAIYCLTAQGRNTLIQQGVVPPEAMTWHKDRNRGTFPFKQHELEVSDIRVALTVASRTSIDATLCHFGRGADYYDRVINREPAKFEQEHIPIRPDGFFILQMDNGYHNFFLEVDRGTMKLSRLHTKLKGYKAYYFEGGYWLKYGQGQGRKEDHSFRVLMTCPTEETRNNRLEVACNARSYTMMWFGIHEDVAKDPFGKVWVRGKEYVDALKSVPPEEQLRWAQAKNKRERDQFIRDHVPLQSVID